MNNVPQYQTQASITINATKKQAWQILEDFDDVYKWAPGVVESHGIGEKKLGVGHGRYCKIKGLGAIDEFITRWEPLRGFTYTVTPLGPLHNASSQWQIAETENGQTRLVVTLSHDLRFGVFGKLMYVMMMKNKLKSSLNQTVASVKTRVENTPLVTSTQLEAAVN